MHRKSLSYAVYFGLLEANDEFILGRKLYKYISTVYDYKSEFETVTLITVYNVNTCKYEVINVDSPVGDKYVIIC